MKTFVLVLVLAAIWIMPSQSQEGCEVSDAQMMATSKYDPKVDPIFEDEMTKAICINQAFEPGRKNVHYFIFIKNTGETKLTNIILEDDLPAGTFYTGSEYIVPYGALTPKEIVRNPDGTTKHVIWVLGELQTGEETWIKVSIDRNDATNDQKNAVIVTAIALSESEMEVFDMATKEIAAISVADLIINENFGKNLTCKITVKNIGKTRLTDVVLNDTLPSNMKYAGSMYSEPAGEEALPKPTIISNPDGTTERLSWFLGDLDSGTQKSIDLIVSCSSDSFSNWNEWEDNNHAEAIGWTSIVHKIPILVIGGEEQRTIEVEEPITPSEENESAAMPDNITG